MANPQDVVSEAETTDYDPSFPMVPSPGISDAARTLQTEAPDLYAAWEQHIVQGFENNQVMFKRILDAFMTSHKTTVWMYRILFGVGIMAFILAAGFSILRENAIYHTLVFGGLSLVTALPFFLSGPLKALEQNLKFITWLGIIYNSYWVRLMAMQNMGTFQAEAKAATAETVQQLEQLLDKYTELSGKRPTLEKTDG